MNAKNGFFSLSLLPVALMVVGSIAEAIQSKPVVMPPVETPWGTVLPVLLSDKFLGPILATNILALVVWLWKTIRNSEKKERQEILALVKNVPDILNRLEQIDRHLTKVPTESDVKVMILKSQLGKDL
jgi:hypothetical protein